MNLWRVCDAELSKIQEDVERLTFPDNDGIPIGKRLRMLAIDLNRVASVMRLICQEKEKDEL